MDLIGPFSETEELRSGRPSDIYLTGILWPQDSALGAEEDDRLSASGLGEESEGSASEEEQVPAARQLRPSVAGLSFALRTEGAQEPGFFVTISFGTYYRAEVPPDGDAASASVTHVWRRRPHRLRVGPLACAPSETLNIPLHQDYEASGVSLVEDQNPPQGIRLHVRAAPWGGNRLITVTLVNGNIPDPDEGRIGSEEATLFQVGLKVEPASGSMLVARPPRRILADEEGASLTLLYRKAREFAVGHTCSADWDEPDDGRAAACVCTSWLPTSVVRSVSSAGHARFRKLLSGPHAVLSLDWLMSATGDDLAGGLRRFANAYGDWISDKVSESRDLPPGLADAGEENLRRCREAHARMLAGVELIVRDKVVRNALRMSFSAMRLQYDWSRGESSGRFIWRPFQLGFILLTLPSIAVRDHPERDFMDLLWFPTGGGKTEAYLALVAFIAFYRRLVGGDSEAGVAVVMRYTLRLLTTQQFARAAAVILACEAMRRGRTPGVTDGINLGKTPFSIGLWVGGEATPNKFAEARNALQGHAEVASPEQLSACPACGNKLRWTADEKANRVEAKCANTQCLLYDDRAPLPVWTVDEDLYREKPTLVIGTIDKFAQIVRRKEIDDFFGLRTGHPPDLVIQDELHLISGPLGTVAALYEVALDRMFSVSGNRPKIIGSTATIRRAADQVRALFNRELRQFPPPGLDADDSGFAVAEPVSDASPGRRYAAVTTAGRSAKFTLQAICASLLQSADAITDPVSRDHYATLVAYFNSLRELGGALVLMQDDVADSVRMYAERHGEAPRVLNLIQELTSRRTQAEIRDMLGTLAVACGEPGSIDAVLATNMLSVGVDIPRLGLMVVNGQPKGIAEYIQSTSRVGRGAVPGLVVSVLNNAKARDRSHFETFRTWHETLYRDVEATSVTPFASRARDRALHAVLVTLCRQLIAKMHDSPVLDGSEAAVSQIVDDIVARASAIDAGETDVERELHKLIRTWQARQPEHYWNDKDPRGSLLQSAELAATRRAVGATVGAAWPTLNTMRNVEPATPFRMTERLRVADEDNAEADRAE